MADQRGMVEGGPVIGDREAKLDTRNGKPDGSKDRPIKEVRATDIEPYTGLRYLSKLFRFMSVILVLLLIAEVVTGMYTQGSAAIPTLLGEASRLIVLAGVLWGTGDLAHLLIDVGHDVRATRILGARVAYAMKTSPIGANRSTDRLREDVSFSDRPISRDNVSDRGSSDEGPPIP